MKKMLSNLFLKRTRKDEASSRPGDSEKKGAVSTKKEEALKVVGERYGRAITRLSDT